MTTTEHDQNSVEHHELDSPKDQSCGVGQCSLSHRMIRGALYTMLVLLMGGNLVLFASPSISQSFIEMLPEGWVFEPQENNSLPECAWKKGSSQSQCPLEKKCCSAGVCPLKKKLQESKSTETELTKDSSLEKSKAEKILKSEPTKKTCCSSGACSSKEKLQKTKSTKTKLTEDLSLENSKAEKILKLESTSTE